MPMKQQISVMLERFGSSAQVTVSGQTHPVKAFIQPLRYKNKLYLESAIGQFGLEDAGAYLYIGPPEPKIHPLGEDCSVCYDGAVYQVSRAERITVGDVPLYVWAVIRPSYLGGSAEAKEDLA